MFKVTILSANIVERKGEAKGTGKPYHLRIQTGYLHTCGPDGAPGEIPDKFDFLLDADQVPFPRGKYVLHPSAVYVGRDGRLEVAPRLAPEQAPANKSAAA